MRTCTIDGCEKKHVAQGFCSTHYASARSSGTIGKLDESNLHVMTDVDAEKRIGTCRVCGPNTPAWKGKAPGAFMCGTKGRAHSAAQRAKPEIREYHRQYSRNRFLKTRLARYNLTLEQWNELVLECGEACSICRKPLATTPEQYVDHDHSCCPGGGSCGECVRAILCRSCNFGIAAFRDVPDVLRNAASYLEKHAS